MKKRSLCLFGHRTSISLEEPFWESLQEIAEKEDISIQKLVERIDQTKIDKNLSSSLRIYILEFYKKK